MIVSDCSALKELQMKSTIFFILFYLASITNALADETIELRCSLSNNGRTTERTFYYDENGLNTSSSQENKGTTSENDVDYIKMADSSSKCNR